MLPLFVCNFYPLSFKVESADAAALSALLHHALHVLGSMDVMDSASGDTPLMLACRLGHDEMAAICLRHGAKNDPHPSFGQTALQVMHEGRGEEEGVGRRRWNG